MSTKESQLPAGGLDGFFGITARKSSAGTEIIAGLTTFMTMAYILFVNSSVLADAGMEPRAVLMATALAAGIGSLIMGLYANLPFALAPGMGLNAYFAYSVVIGMGLSWQTVLGAVFLDGVFFLIISLLPIRERIIQDIPMNLKLATSVAIGLFIAFIGLKNAGIIVANPDTVVALGKFNAPGLVALFGVVLMGFLLARKVRGALLWGILGTTVVGMFVKTVTPEGAVTTVTQIPTRLGDVVALPHFGILSSTMGQLDIKGALGMGLITVIFTFTFVDLFDTAGTLIGLATKLDIIDEKGSFKGAGRALISDAIATVIGALVGTSTTTTYIESAAGTAEGGRTGLTAVTVGVLFLVALFFWPLAGVIPAVATAPALILVGLFMMEPILKIDLTDYTEALPAFLTLLMVPFTFSIANGIIFGILAYTLLKLVTGRVGEVSVIMWILSVLFVIYFVI